MDKIKEIEKELMDEGRNPKDFNITVKADGSVEVSPKNSFFQREIAKEQDEYIKVDIDIIAELTLSNAVEKENIYDMLESLSDRIKKLEEKTNG